MATGSGANTTSPNDGNDGNDDRGDDDDGEDDGPTPGTTGGDATGGSSTTGELAECVDEDLAMATGVAIAMGSSAEQGDDFDWNLCGGGFDDGGFDTFGDVGEDDLGEDDGLGSTSFFSTGASSEGGFDSGDDGGRRGPGDDYVLSWTPPTTGPYTVSLEGAMFDTIVSVTPPMCGAASVACNDDCFDLQSGLTFDATMGETVFIVIDGFAGETGAFTLSITEGDTLMCDGFGDSGGSDGGGGEPPPG